MPRLSYMMVDGMAFVLVGIGLTAVVVGYGHNRPASPEQLVVVAEVESTWADPKTTGAITPKDKAAATKGASPRGAKVETVSQPTTGGVRAWVDPPRR